MRKLFVFIGILFVFNIIIDSYLSHIKHLEYLEKIKIANEINDKQFDDIMNKLESIEDSIELIEKQRAK